MEREMIFQEAKDSRQLFQQLGKKLYLLE